MTRLLATACLVGGSVGLVSISWLLFPLALVAFVLAWLLMRGKARSWEESE